MPHETCFAADAMLGRLARWLRVLGFDTSYDPQLPDPVLVAMACDEGRVLLTRDRHLLCELRPARFHEVRQDAPLAQLQALVEALRLPPPPELFCRCMLCNALLSPPLPEVLVRDRLPPGQWGEQDLPGPVRECPRCARVYWHGSHTRRMRATLERALPGWLP